MSANKLKLNADETQVMMWPVRHQVTVASLLQDRDLTLTIRTDTAAVAAAVRVLGVFVTPDLALGKHATSVSAKCFYQLRHAAATCTTLYSTAKMQLY